MNRRTAIHNVGTVEVHLTRIYRKLGLRSRADLARGGRLRIPRLRDLATRPSRPMVVRNVVTRTQMFALRPQRTLCSEPIIVSKTGLKSHVLKPAAETVFLDARQRVIGRLKRAG